MIQPIARTSSTEAIMDAQDALTRRDFKRAAQHAGRAALDDPENSTLRRLFDQISAEAPSPERLIRDSPGLSLGDVAARAYLCAAVGNYNAALFLIARLNSEEPDGRFMTWAARWLKLATVHVLSPQAVTGMLVGLMRPYRGDSIADQTVRGRLAHLMESVTTYSRALPERNPYFDLICAIVLQKLGQLEQAITHGEAACAAKPKPDARTLLVMSYGHGQDSHGSQKKHQFMEGAITLDPAYLDVLSDVADLLIALERIEEGATTYGMVMEADPSHWWAAPSFYFYHYQLDRDIYWKEKFCTFAAVNRDNPRVIALESRLPSGDDDDIAFVSYLPEPGEAVINIARQFADEEQPPTGEVKLTLSALEPPSAMLAFDRFLAPDAWVVLNEIKFPWFKDPREAVYSSKLTAENTLWKYDGVSATPAVAKPSWDTADAVAEIAATPYHIKSWSAAARELGKKLGEGKIKDLLAVMVHPPEAPEDFTEWDWIQGVQIAAALTIVYTGRDWERPIQKKGLFGKSSEPSPRHSALNGLLFGIGDWTTTAAIIALTQIALEEPERERQIAKWFSDLYYYMPKKRYVAYSYALGMCSLRLPSMQKMTVRADMVALTKEA